MSLIPDVDGIDTRGISSSTVKTDLGAVVTAVVSARNAHNSQTVEEILHLLNVVALRIADLHV